MNYDKVILELMSRIVTLEEEVATLKKKVSIIEVSDEDISEIDTDETESINSTGRDTTKYILDGKKYGKNRLVLAVVKKYMKENPDTTAEELLEIFDKSLQGSLGVVRILDEVKVNYSDYKTRFFMLPNEQIKTSTKNCVVCTQWGIANIGNIVTRAKQLGIDIAIVK